jgi:hypothetical protein
MAAAGRLTGRLVRLYPRALHERWGREVEADGPAVMARSGPGLGGSLAASRDLAGGFAGRLALSVLLGTAVVIAVHGNAGAVVPAVLRTVLLAA